MIKEIKRAKLFDDEFAPSEVAIPFWRIPKGVLMLGQLSWGAKALYGVLYGMAHKHGTAYPSHDRIKKWMGNPSDSTLYRWQQELVQYRLIRVLQKGRGLSNNYYFIRSPLLENMTKSEYDLNRRVVYRGPLTTESKLVTHDEAVDYYCEEIRQWFDKSERPGQYPMPRPYFICDTEWRKQSRETWRWLLVDKYLFESGDAFTTEFAVE